MTMLINEQDCKQTCEHRLNAADCHTNRTHEDLANVPSLHSGRTARN